MSPRKPMTARSEGARRDWRSRKSCAWCGTPLPPVARPDDLQFDNGYGGFSGDAREYIVYLEPGQYTPAPWINVVANPGFGFLVSKAGAGYTWAANSGENRLTPWRNDPVTDAPGEALYLRDDGQEHVVNVVMGRG